MKISKAQVEILQVLSEPKGQLEFNKDDKEVWLFGLRIPDTRIRMSTFNVLRNRRLIKICDRWKMPTRNYYKITPAGLETLAEAGGGREGR